MGKKKINTLVVLDGKYLKDNKYNIPSIKGEIYELYCYNYLLDTCKDINIIRAKCINSKKYGNFEYSTNGKIVYYSNNILLAEYDVLGIKSNTIYWWEITRHHKIEVDFVEKIKMKMELLGKIFKCFDIDFKIISPQKYSSLKEFKIEIIDEPLYDLYFRKFKISNNIKNSMSLQTLSEKSNKYDYIDDVIRYSRKYYDKNDTNIIEDEYLIKRLYNLNTISSNNIEYFDIRRKINGLINMDDDGFINTSEERFNLRIKQEIMEIKNKIKKSEHFA
jgi:hypothetical protein